MNKLTPAKVKKIFGSFLEESGYKPNTIIGKLIYVKCFLNYLRQKKKAADLRDITRKKLRHFLDYLDSYVSQRTKKPLARRTRGMIFRVVKQLFGCLYQQELLLTNPVQNMRYKPRGDMLQRVVLSREQMAVFLDSIDITRSGGLRERCIFELMYSSGLRSSEVANLNIGDIDFDSRMLLVREAKWGKDRVVPVSKVAIAFLKQFVIGRLTDREAPVFPGRRHGRIGINTINIMLKNRAVKLGMYKKGLSAHSIRHSVSVHLLGCGADLRYVQELLGHESIETTAGYTHELYDNLKKIYRSFHPRENEYYTEVDEDYLEQLGRFYRRLFYQKKKTRGCRASKKRWAKRRKENHKK